MDIEPASERLIGQVLASRYRIEARIGDGAMGTVYRARHVRVGRAFAIKVLHRRFLTDIKTRRRFAREAELAGTLHHANVVSVVDVGETLEGLNYLVMEYADGGTLRDLISDAAPMPAPRFIAIARQLCDGLQHAHELGLIHRDLKTENVLVERTPRGTDSARIVDFGIAILREDAASWDPARLTSAGLVVGTPHYMAPEHATNAPIDHRIDLFALGVMCFEMLTGIAPFEGDGVDVARANLQDDTPVMSVRVAGLRVDPLLEAFTRHLMMKSRDDRPATAQAARELLDLIEHDRPAAAAALGVAPEGAPPATRSRAPRMPLTRLALPPVPPPAPHVRSTGGTRDDPPPASWIGDETEQIALVRSRRVELAIAVLALLSVVVAIALAMRARRPIQPIAAPIAPASIERAALHESPPPPTVREPVDAVEPPGVTNAPRATTRSRGTEGDRSIAWDGPRDSLARGNPRGASPSSRPPEASLAIEQVALRVPAPVDEPGPRPDSERDISPPSAQPIPLAASRTATPLPADVAQLYATVGKRLKALDQTRGSAATADLWPLYLRVHINDVISSPMKCAEADVLLRHLYEQVVKRSRTHSSRASPPAGSREISVNPGGSSPPNP